MKKRILACLLAFSLSAMMLTACGGSQKTPETQKAAETAAQTETAQTEAVQTEAATTEVPETEAPATEAPETAAPETETVPAAQELTKDSWLGTWTSVRVAAEGATITGDLSQLEVKFVIELNDDDTANVSFNDDTKECRWSTADGTSAVLTINDNEVPMTINGNDELEFTTDPNGTAMTIVFARGEDPKSAPAYDVEKAVPVTDPSVLEGAWKPAAMVYNGTCIEGNFEAFGGFDLQFDLNADGTGTMGYGENSEEINWTADENGAAITIDDESAQLMALDDYLVVDMTSTTPGLYFIMTK